MSKNFRSRFLFVTLALLSLVFSCKKDKNEEPNEASLQALKLTIAPYEIAVLEAKNISLDKETYNATFDDKEVVLGHSENNLVFIVPEIAAGDHNLKVVIDGEEYSVVYHVGNAPVVTNPNQYLRDKLQQLRLSPYELDSMKVRLLRLPGSSELAGQLDLIKKIYADLDEKMSKATTEEISAAANVVAANPDLFARPAFDLDLAELNLFKTSGAANNPELIGKQLDIKINRACGLIIAGGLATAVIIDFAPGYYKLAGGITGGVTAGLIYAVGSFVIEGTQSAIERTDDMVMKDINAQKGTAGNVFTKNQLYSVNVTSQYSNLNKQSLATGSKVINSIAANLDVFATQFNKVLGRFPEWLAGKPFHFKNVLTKTTKELSVSPQYLSIKNISNSKVSVSVDNAGDFLKVKFSTTENTDQNFSYDLVYEADGFVSHTQKMNGTVSNAESFCDKFSGDPSSINMGTLHRAVDDRFLYKYSATDKKIECYDAGRNLKNTIDLSGSFPGTLGGRLYAYNGFLWILHNSSSTESKIYKIDRDNGSLISTTTLQSGSYSAEHLFVNTDGKIFVNLNLMSRIWVGNTQYLVEYDEIVRVNESSGVTESTVFRSGITSGGSTVRNGYRIYHEMYHKGYAYMILVPVTYPGNSGPTLLSRVNLSTGQEEILDGNVSGYPLLWSVCGKLYLDGTSWTLLPY